MGKNKLYLPVGYLGKDEKDKKIIEMLKMQEDIINDKIPKIEEILTELDLSIIRLRVQGKSYKSIGDTFGLSTERIRQRVLKTIRRIGLRCSNKSIYSETNKLDHIQNLCLSTRAFTTLSINKRNTISELKEVLSQFDNDEDKINFLMGFKRCGKKLAKEIIDKLNEHKEINN